MQGLFPIDKIRLLTPPPPKISKKVIDRAKKELGSFLLSGISRF